VERGLHEEKGILSYMPESVSGIMLYAIKCRRKRAILPELALEGYDVKRSLDAILWMKGLSGLQENAYDFMFLGEQYCCRAFHLTG